MARSLEGSIRARRWLGSAACVMLLALGMVLPVSGAQGDTVRVSVGEGASQPDDSSSRGILSGDGRFVAFESQATNLVGGDTNGVIDIFVFDRQTGATSRVSIASGGDEADDRSDNPDLSSDGRYVAFDSDASNLVSGDTNATTDVFVHDLQSGVTSRVSIHNNGSEANDESLNPSLSDDALYVVFESSASNLADGDTNGAVDVFVHDRDHDDTWRVSISTAEEEANGGSFGPVISGDGKVVAFESSASNLVEDDTNGVIDIFVHEIDTGVTERVSIASDGSQANGLSLNPALSQDGRFIAFESVASNLVDDDTNGTRDVFIHDRDTDETFRVSVHSGGTQANDNSNQPAISADGRYVAFQSVASNLVDNDVNGFEDVFVHDRQTGTTTLVSVDSTGHQADGGDSNRPALSGDGRFVAFDSLASNLVEGDTNAVRDVFVHHYLADSAPPTTSTTDTTPSSPTEPTSPTGTTDPTSPSNPSSTTSTTTPTSTTTTTTTTLPVIDHFVDIAHSTFRDDINTIAAAGVARGCNPPANDRFCPEDPVTRGQVAAFLNRALGLDSAGDQGLVDVDGSVFVDDINNLFGSGVSRGCNPPVNDRFCPEDPVTRGQVAAFLNRALGLGSAGDQGLVDVDGSVFVDDINNLFGSGVSRGCNPPANDRFCPTEVITRGQLAAFLRRALAYWAG